MWLPHANPPALPGVAQPLAAPTPTPAETGSATVAAPESASAASTEAPPWTLIGPGASGAAVRWLRTRLALAAGQPVPDPLSEVFDAALAEQVRAFQRDHGLQPDGLAGPRTLEVLNNLAPAANAPAPPPSEGNL